MITLVFKSGPKQGEHLQLADSRITLGRSPDNHIALEDHRVSWDHCVIEQIGGQYQVTDLGSSNGTFVGADRDAVTLAHPLATGEIIWVGDSEIVIQFGDRAVPQRKRRRTVLDTMHHDLQDVLVGDTDDSTVKVDGDELARKLAELDQQGSGGGGSDTDVDGNALVLRVASGPLAGKKMVAKGDKLTIGSNESADFPFGGVPDILANVVVDGDDFVIERVAQDGDILLNGGLVMFKAPLSDGAFLQFGDHVMEVAIELAGGVKIVKTATVELSDMEKSELAQSIAEFASSVASHSSVNTASPKPQTVQLDTNAQANLHAEVMRIKSDVDEDADTLVYDGHPADLAADIANYRDKAMSGEVLTEPWLSARESLLVLEPDDVPEQESQIPKSFRTRGRLIVLSGPHARRQVFVTQSPVSLGRSADSDVVFADMMVSGEHCTVVLTGDKLAVSPIDGASVAVNGGETTNPTSLGHRDLLTIGGNIVEFRAPGIDPVSEDPGQTTLVPQPRFCFRETVLVQWEITVGRDEDCELPLFHPSVAPRHLRIHYTDGFFSAEALEDAEVNAAGQTIKSVQLADGLTLDVGQCHLTMAIDGLRCAIEVTEPAALAAGPMKPSDSGHGRDARVPGPPEAPGRPDSADVKTVMADRIDHNFDDTAAESSGGGGFKKFLVVMAILFFLTVIVIAAAVSIAAVFVYTNAPTASEAVESPGEVPGTELGEEPTDDSP